MKKILLAVLALLISWLTQAQEKKWAGKSVDMDHGKLVVSANKRFLVFEDGTPFFWLGDTAWELFHRLTKAEAEKYLENRREKGFTVIQAVILSEPDGLHTPNAEGELPLINDDPTRINEKYFAHIDWIIKKAEEKGIFIGLLPTWGDKVDNSWGIGPVIFNVENAEVYGKILGNRYKHVKNIIWINGGDRSGEKKFAVWNALAKGIRSTDTNHLMTFHPMGETSSSFWFHNESWLDFNMCQTGHSQRSYTIYRMLTEKDYARLPVKPCIDGEPRYEDHPVKRNPEQYGWYYDADVRQAMYWSLFAGSFGHTYGCHAIWQMFAKGRKPINFVRHTWEEDLDLPGARDLIHARNLMESRPFTERRPFQSILKNDLVPETDYLVATRGNDYIFVYSPTGRAPRLDLDQCQWKEAQAWWFNPRTGEAGKGERLQAKGIRSFEPPTKGVGNDWILVLDNPAAGFGEPGKL